LKGKLKHQGGVCKALENDLKNALKRLESKFKQQIGDRDSALEERLGEQIQ